MKKIGCLQKRKFHLIQFALTGLAVSGLSASAQVVITAAPVPPFVGSGSASVSTGTSSGMFGGLAVTEAGTGAGTLVIGQAAGPALTLSDTATPVAIDLSVANTVSSVTVMSSATVSNDDPAGTSTILLAAGTVANTGRIFLSAGTGNAIAITGAGTVTNSGTIAASAFGNANDGVLISGGGMVTNTAGGSITGDVTGVEIMGGTAATNAVTNSGTIIGSTVTGVALDNGGTVTNLGAGTITGFQNGVVVQGGAGTVINSGNITGSSGVGIQLGAGGTINNNAGGVITGASSGVKVITGAGTVTNSGTISGTTAGDIGIAGVLLQGGGTVTNLAGGNINGDTNGVDIGGGTAAGNVVTNSGTILANTGNTGNEGVELEIGGTVNNSSTGSITGVVDGVDVMVGNGTINNAGSITGTTNNGVNLEAGGSVSNSGAITGANGISDQGGTFAADAISNTTTGTIVGTVGVGIALSTGSVSNGGTIQGAATAITIGNQAAVSNSGVIAAGTTGIALNSALGNSTVVLQGGSIGAIPGGAAPVNDVLVQGATPTTTVTINGRTLLNSTGTNIVGGGGTLVLHLVGLTAAQQAAISTANPNMATLTAGGETYSITGFSAIVNQSVSLGSAVDSGLQDLGNKLDATGLPTNNPAYDIFYNAALADPEAAVANLSGRVLTQGVNDLEINSRSGLLSDLGNQFDNLIESDNIGGIDLSHFSIGTNQMLAFTDTSSQLDSLVNIANCQIGGTEMSDSKAMAPVSAPISTAKWGVWASGTIQIADKDSSAGNTGFHAVNGSPSIGVDYRVCPDLTLGALFSYTTAGAQFNDGSTIDSSTELGGLYGVYQHDGWRAHLVAAGGVSQYNNTRSTFSGDATSNPDGTDVISDLTGGYQFKLGPSGKLRVTPEVGVQYTHLQQDGFTENGPAPFAISRGSFDTDSLRTHVGFRSEYAFQVGQGLQFIPEFRAAWYHECLDDASGVSTSLTGAPALGSFSVRTFDPERDYALVGVGLNTAFTGYHGMPTGLFLNYDAQVGQSDFIQHNVSLGVRVAF